MMLSNNVIGDEEPFSDQLSIDQEFTRCWINERSAPEVLQYQTGLVGDLLELLNNQQAILDEVPPETPEASFAQCLLQMEMERIRFLLQSYLQHRLLKLQAYWMFYSRFSRDELKSFLSPTEIDHLFRFRNALVTTLQRQIHPLDSVPGIQSTIDDDDDAIIIPIPPLHSHVIVRVRETIGAAKVDTLGNTIADLVAGDIYVLEYRVAREFLQTGQIELI